MLSSAVFGTSRQEDHGELFGAAGTHTENEWVLGQPMAELEARQVAGREDDTTPDMAMVKAAQAPLRRTGSCPRGGSVKPWDLSAIE